MSNEDNKESFSEIKPSATWKIPWYIVVTIIFIDAIVGFMASYIQSVIRGFVSLSIGIVILLFIKKKKEVFRGRGLIALLFMGILIILGFLLGSLYWLAAFVMFIYAILRWTVWKHTW